MIKSDGEQSKSNTVEKDPMTSNIIVLQSMLSITTTRIDQKRFPKFSDGKEFSLPLVAKN